jgi:hypothetical protein
MKGVIKEAVEIFLIRMPTEHVYCLDRLCSFYFILQFCLLGFFLTTGPAR